MKSIVIWALLALNGVLLAELVSSYVGDNAAMAARAGGRKPDIVMIPGKVVGESNSVVYLIDSANRRVGAVALDNNGKELVGLSPLDLERVFEDGNRRGADDDARDRRRGR